MKKKPRNSSRKGCRTGRRIRLASIFADNVRNWRKDGGWTLKRVAGDLGLSIAIVSEWEHGHRFPSIEHLDALAKYVGIPACRLLCKGDTGCELEMPGADAKARGSRT